MVGLRLNETTQTSIFERPAYNPNIRRATLKAWNDGAVLTLTTLWPRLKHLSFMHTRRLNVPVIMLLGRHDYATPSSITAKWMNELSAPRTRVVWFEHSAHLPMIEESGRVLKALLEQVHRPISMSAASKVAQSR